MHEQGLENEDASRETFTPGLEIVPDHLDPAVTRPDAEVLDFVAAADRRREAALSDIDRLADPPDTEEIEPQQDLLSGPNAEVISISAQRGKNLIAGPTNERGRSQDRLADLRPDANNLLSRMLQDKAFAKALLRKKDLGTNYTHQGITEAMAAAALPYARRAMRAGNRGNRYERMDLYKQAASEAANHVGRWMDLENVKQTAYDAGRRFQETNTAGRKVDYEPRKKPINYLSRQGLAGRFGIHLPALRRRK